MASIITATEQELKDVFNDKYLFEIPLYQRPYAWTTEQVDELLDDLKDAMRRDSEAPYFLGSVVLIKDDHDTLSQVVDGQQRLTTLTMLLCVLRDLSSNSDSKQELDEFIRQKGSLFKGTKDIFRLLPRDRDREFFQENIQKSGSIVKFLKQDPVKFTDSQRRMFANIRYLHRELKKLDETERDRLGIYVAQKCLLVVVSASDGESAYRIFSVMNDRGLDLSPTDILKANIIGKIEPDDVQGKYTAQWEGIEEKLGRDDFRDLFAHIRMIYRKEKLRGTLQKEFQDYVLGKLNCTESMKFCDCILEPYAEAYEIVSTASYESSNNADKLNALLQHLGRLDNFDWIPPTMEYFRINEGQTDTLTMFIHDLERLAYGMFILRSNINERIRRYARVIGAIQNQDDLYSVNSPLQLSVQEKSDILETLNGNIYSLIRVRRPLLLRLDSICAEPESGASYQYPIISIEHVLPQNPQDESQWIEWFPEEDERRAWTHRLANLVLLSRRKNSGASNYEFDVKKSKYFQQNGTTTFALTTQVVSEPKWTPRVLERRQCQLIDAIRKEWRLD